MNALKTKKVDYYNAQATLETPEKISLLFTDKKKQQLTAKKIVIAVGTRPYHPEDVSFGGVRILDSDTILNLQEIPKSLIVYGGGVIGCEYATMFSRLSTEVFLVNPKPKLLDFLDQDLSAMMQELMKLSHIHLIFGQDYQVIEESEKKVKLVLRSAETLQADYLLYANGRRGNAENLGLENCSIPLNSRNQIPVNEHYQTLNPNIYAVGDIIGFPSLVSTGNEQGRCAAQHAILGTNKFLNSKNIPLAVYTIPEIAAVGLTEAELKSSHTPYEKGICYFRELARPSLVGEEDGFIKLLFCPKTKILFGVHILGYYASDLIHIGQAVIHYQGTLDYFLEEVINFPTFSSGYKVAALEGLSKII